MHARCHIHGRVARIVHAVKEPVGKDFGECVDRLHGIGSYRRREDAAIHHVKVRHFLSSNYVPHPLPRRYDRAENMLPLSRILSQYQATAHQGLLGQRRNRQRNPLARSGNLKPLTLFR
jgi:hypothetical protein